MQFYLCIIPLLCSFFVLRCSAFEDISDFSFSLAEDPSADLFSLQDSFDDNALDWDLAFDDGSDSPFLLASDCSAFSSSIFGAKRVRRGDSADFCRGENAPSRSTAGEGGHSDDTVDLNGPLDNILSIPSLADYDNEKNDDCFRMSNGQLPLAICELAGASSYILPDGQLYYDLLIAYPSKTIHHFFPFCVFLLAHIFYGEGSSKNPDSYYHSISVISIF